MIPSLRYIKFFIGCLIIGTYLATSINLYSKYSIIEMGDTASYDHIATAHFFSTDTWANNKPPIMPMIIKITGSHAYTSLFLLLFSCIAWVSLALAVATSVKYSYIKIIGIISVLLFSLANELFFWSTTMLSESISISLFVLVIALTLFWLLYRFQILLISAIFSLLCWSWSRDTNMYVIAMIVGGMSMYLLAHIKVWKKHLPLIGIGLLLTTSIFLQQQSMRIGQRTIFPLVNVISQRILPDPNATTFFADNGMPINENVMRFTGQWASSFHSD